MELKEYLTAIETCPDEIVSHDYRGLKNKISLLTAEHGIYDNFDIYLNADPDKFESFLQESDYTLQGRFSREEKSFSKWYYNQGTVVVSVHKWNISDEERRKRVRMEYGDFSLNVCLHPYQGNSLYPDGEKMEGKPWQRAIALVVLDIGKWALKEKTPVLMPNSIGWRYLEGINWKKAESHPRVVRFNPK